MALNEQNNCNVRLQAATEKIAFLEQALLDKEQELLNTDTGCFRESERLIELEDSVVAWQDKYDRLYDSHKRVQKINQNLEDKLLKLVDRNETERAQLTSDVATMSVRLAQANYNIATLQREIERYKTDINLAINLLQCKPDSFVPQKVSSLPIDVQSKVSSYMLIDTNSHSDSEGSTSGVGIGFGTSGSYKALPASDSPPPSCSFSPASVVYSMRNSDERKNTANVNLCKNRAYFDKSNSRSPIPMGAPGDIKSTVPLNSDVSNNIGSRNTNNNHNNNNNSSNYDKNSNRNSNNKIANGLIAHHDLISPSIMAKFLEDELKSSEVKHCSSCQCTSKDLTVLANVSHSYSVSTQTTIPLGNMKTFSLGDPISMGLCLRCNSNLNSPSRTNSPSYRIKILRSNDSVISDTKSSDVSDVNDMDKLYTGAKRDDLMVNPILSHHRLCERTTSNHFAHGRRLSYSGNCQSNSSNGNSNDVNNDLSRSELLDSMNMQLNKENEQIQQREENCMNGIEDEEDEVKPLLSDFSSTNETNVDECKKMDDSKERSVAKVFNNSSDSTQGSISGSVNSMWSKISNFEGVKIFENFNRNLIKTIKAENPKYQGPRLCAIRIQQTDNGSGNILLDNTESVGITQPIVYTKRERFVDEELDDDGNITVTSSKNEIRSMDPLENSSQNKSDQDHKEDPLIVKTEDELENFNIPKILLKSIDPDTNENCLLTSRVPPIPPKSPPQKHDDQVILKHESHCSTPFDYIIKEVVEEEEKEKEMSIPILPKAYHDQKINRALGPMDQMIQSDIGCRNSHNSYTSTAISEANDLPENEQFRRQQLNRVAEWIQNNSKQQQNKRRQTLTDAAIALRQTKSTALGYINSKQPSSPFCSIAFTPQDDQNVNVSSDNVDNHKCSWVISSGSDLPIIYNTTNTLSDSSKEHLSAFDVFNYKYYPWNTDRSLAIEAKLHTTSQHVVDIAQMEYNVKQFLLKQNEWSIRNSNRIPTGPTTATTTTTTNKQSESLEGRTSISTTIIAYETETHAKRYVGTTKQQQPQQRSLRSLKTIKQSKMYNVARIGPGVGERVIPTGVTGVSGMAICKIESQQQQQQDQHKQSQTGAQRTETNL